MTTLAFDQLILGATGFDFALQQPIFPGKLLLWGLFMLSLLSWGVIISKIVSLVRMKRADEEFVKYYRGGRQPLQLFERNYEDRMSLRSVIYDYGSKEAAFQMLGSPDRDETFAVRLRTSEGITEGQMKSVHEALGRGELAAAARLRDGLPLLSVASLAAPFGGLLGMAWILMKTFSQHGMSGTLADVSPGVSGALAMLVVGLVVATPSLLGHILLNATCRERMRQLGDFRSEYARALEYAYSAELGMPMLHDDEGGAMHHDQPLTAYDRAHAGASAVDLDGDQIEEAAASLESSADLESYAPLDSPFVLIDEDEVGDSDPAERPIAAFANPEDDRPPLEEPGYLFSTPFAESDDDDVNPIARQTAVLAGAGNTPAIG